MLELRECVNVLLQAAIGSAWNYYIMWTDFLKHMVISTYCYAVETEIFRAYAFSSHSLSDGSGVWRSLQMRDPYFNRIIKTPTTNRVTHVVAGQNMCSPILA